MILRLILTPTKANCTEKRELRVQYCHEVEGVKSTYCISFDVPIHCLRTKVYLEEGLGRPGAEAPVFDFVLFRKIVRARDGTFHAFKGQVSGEVGGVRGDHDEREEPPHPRHQSRRNRSAGQWEEATRIELDVYFFYLFLFFPFLFLFYVFFLVFVCLFFFLFFASHRNRGSCFFYLLFFLSFTWARCRNLAASKMPKRARGSLRASSCSPTRRGRVCTGGCWPIRTAWTWNDGHCFRWADSSASSVVRKRTWLFFFFETVA